MATTKQILNACDDMMKLQISKLLIKFFNEAVDFRYLDRRVFLKPATEKYTEIFFKIVNMDKKYCQPKEY